jgi:DNA-binding beta-propeller fold protein YncE
VQTVASLENLEVSRGFFSKVLSIFGGEEQRKLQLVQPVGIGVMRDGRLLIADPGANGVHVIDLKEHKYEFLAGPKDGSFASPVGIAVDNAGNVYISDSQRGYVCAFDPGLDFRFAVNEHLERPTGLATSGGRLYVADAARHAVVMFDLQGHYAGEFGKRGGGAGEFNFPVGIAARRDSLMVVDALNYRVQEFDSTGHFLSAFGAQGNVAGRFAGPKGIAFDSDGDAYVTDALMDNIQIFNPSGTLLLIVGSSGSRDGDFSSPGGIAVGPDDRIYVVETFNRRVQIFQYLK